MLKFLSLTNKMTEVIRISSLEKSYGNIEAVKGINLSVNEGEMFGLVGPDGAGKTTTIRILCGLIGCNSGEASLFGNNIRENRKQIQKSIGYLSQKFSLYGDLSIDENIEFFAEIHNVKDYENRRNELLEFTRLKQFRDRLAGKLSGGMKQKLALACSLIHKPKILFLDEPTTGVDPVSRRDFWKILSGLTREGMTIFMTTPYLDEAERCSRVAMMDKGKIIACDSPDNIKAATGKKILEIVCEPVRKSAVILRNNKIPDIQMFGDRLHIPVIPGSGEENKIQTLLDKENVTVFSVRMISQSLENVFMQLIKEAS